MSSVETIPLESWQFFSAVKRVLGKSYLTNLFKVSPRQVDRISCDPACSDSAQKNCLDKYEKILSDLMEVGKERLAKSTVDRQAKIVECHLCCSGDIIPDKNNISDELLDDYPVIVALHDAIRDRRPTQEVRTLLMEAKKELDEDYEAYIKVIE